MKMLLGTTAMWKTSVFMVVVLFALLYGIITTSGASKTYWESVGPCWDRMLNPNKYSEQE